ncbi:MAG TPA: ABC transporter substrate-binding protein, partial [Anaerolineales bacterium]|nr:ABC transporter substrate-binding protein [Anaerolineales bacterium]
MKRKMLLYALLVLTMVLTGCGGQVAPAATEAPSSDSTPQKGGDMVVAYKDDLATLDPAIGYDWTNWPAIKMVFDGLLDYDSGTTIQPRIAEALPQVSADGLTYTFKIRKGVKFHNGRELVADDV